MAPLNLSFFWNLGSLMGVCLVSQIVSGLMLAIHYIPDSGEVFTLIIEGSRDISMGWFMRSVHANGASFFFMLLFSHVGRGLYYGSYVYKKAWIVGWVMFILVMAEGFLGYVLAWGQMSYWGATVITNMFTALPYVGVMLVEWIWGGFIVSGSTLVRFYVIHFLIPFILLVLTVVHLLYLHQVATDGPLGVKVDNWKIPFSPYYVWKDTLGFVWYLGVLFIVSFLTPDFFLDPVNFMEADDMKTPAHIKPEWYFLFAYAILRSVPSKVGGVVVLVLSVVILLFMPYLDPNKSIRGLVYSPLGQFCYWGFVSNFVLLSWVGLSPVHYPYIELGQWFSYVFFIVFFLFPLFKKSWVWVILGFYWK
uniref:Cytochrome b n=2 Tax=Conchocele TaxID=1803737 RepID=A0A1B4WRI2_9BIVA|nr:cytochrome b [Conchocele cf. bisecta HPD1644]